MKLHYRRVTLCYARNVQKRLAVALTVANCQHSSYFLLLFTSIKHHDRQQHQHQEHQTTTSSQLPLPTHRPSLLISARHDFGIHLRHSCHLPTPSAQPLADLRTRTCLMSQTATITARYRLALISVERHAFSSSLPDRHALLREHLRLHPPFPPHTVDLGR